MNKKTKKLFYLFCFFTTFFVVEVFYISDTNSITKDALEKKQLFVSLVKLPDLAISTESTYIRHRSMSDTFSIYKDDGVLREYFPSSFTLSHSHIGKR